MKKVCKIGYDNGFGNQDMTGPRGSINVASHLSEPRGDAIVEQMGLGKDSATERPVHIEFNGGDDVFSYYAGLGAHKKGTAVRSLAYSRLTDGSPLTRALFYATMTAYIGQDDSASTKPRTPIAIWCALPIDTMRSNAVEQTRAGVRDWMVGQHDWEADGIGHRVKIENVDIASQPMAALYDFVLDGKGIVVEDKIPLLDGLIGVISIGMNDLAFMVIDEMEIDEGATASYQSGVASLLERAGNIDRMDVRLRRNLNDPIFDKPKASWYADLLAKSRAAWGQDGWKDFGAILAIGGGVLTADDTLRGYYGDPLYIPKNPVTTVSSGMFKRGQFDG